MVKRSLKASAAGIEQAKQAFQRTGWTQEDLATKIGLGSRQSIWKFFTGKPVERSIFLEICICLNLDWQEIVDLDAKPNPPKSTEVTDIAETPTSDDSRVNNSTATVALVENTRNLLRNYVIAQCANISSINSAQILPLDDIYINVQILQQPNFQNWLEISDLQVTTSPERMKLNDTKLSKIPELQALTSYSKLILLGKPGAAKTTFLQSVGLQCIRGELLADRVPILIGLRTWAANAQARGDFNLLNYLTKTLTNFGISPEQIESLLKEGKALLLLDGLDEIPQEYAGKIIEAISASSQLYYQNQWIITCRIAANQYRFPGFTYLEIADFDANQIEAFAHKWFVSTSRENPELGLNKATQFIQKLNQRENQPIRELAATPILLTLLVSVFQARGNFLTKRSKLYEAGLDILLVRWDEARGIQRDDVYDNLSLVHKLRILSKIAAKTFQQGKFFFEQKEIEQYIAEYLANLSLPSSTLAIINGNINNVEFLRLKSLSVLKAIEVQHGLLIERSQGIYSFSHQTFQEYFTARYIVDNEDAEILVAELASRITNTQWREVFLLTTQLLPNAEPLLELMQAEIAKLVSDNRNLQEFLLNLDRKISSLSFPYQPAAVRAFYFTLFLNRNLGLALALDVHIAHNLIPDLALDLELARIWQLLCNLLKNTPPNIQDILALGFALDLHGILLNYPSLDLALQKLKNQLPDANQGKYNLITWWQNNGKDWAEMFRSILVEYRQIGYDLQCTIEESKLFSDYYFANEVMIDCLLSDCVCSKEFRENLIENCLKPG